ncbi:MAG: hypothetical protein ACHP9T_10535 [Caulobacterales bacterium]|jgi:hypothetical protein
MKPAIALLISTLLAASVAGCMENGYGYHDHGRYGDRDRGDQGDRGDNADHGHGHGDNGRGDHPDPDGPR